MPEFSNGFDDGQIEAMQAAAELADMLEAETGGELGYSIEPRDLHTQDPYNDPGILTIEAADDPERIPFITIWGATMHDETTDPYHYLDIVNVGNVGVDGGEDIYDNYNVYRIAQPETLLDGLGVVVGSTTHIIREDLPEGDPDGMRSTVKTSTTDCRVLGSASVHVLGEAIQAALEYNGDTPPQTMAGGYYDD